MPNHYYFYCVDRDFGPFFLKICSYFPYNAKICLNGNEYLKRQLDREGIAYEALDNGLLSCEDPERAQAICDDLSASKIDALARKWLRRLPHPFPADDRRAGYLYDISILQAEFSLTQVLDRPVTGRIFFEQVIRDNIDLGRPDRIQLVFNRRVTKRTPGLFRTRVITEGVIPSLYVDYKHTRIKQYHKEGRALRTETTINDTRDFAIGKRLQNLPALREDTNKSRAESRESRASTAHTGPFQRATYRHLGGRGDLSTLNSQLSTCCSPCSLLGPRPVQTAPKGLHQSRPQATCLGDPRVQPQLWADVLRSPAATFSWLHRTSASDSALPRDAAWASRCSLHFALLQPPPSARPLRSSFPPPCAETAPESHR